MPITFSPDWLRYVEETGFYRPSAAPPNNTANVRIIHSEPTSWPYDRVSEPENDEENRDYGQRVGELTCFDPARGRPIPQIMQDIQYTIRRECQNNIVGTPPSNTPQPIPLCNPGPFNASYQPNPLQFFGDATDSLFFGLEIEAEARSFEDLHTIAQQVAPLIKIPSLIKYDASLDHGIEIMTYPLSWSWLQEHRADINQTLKVLSDIGFSTPSNTGFHIHMSHKAFTKIQLYKFIKFVNNHREFVHRISQRPEISRFARYAQQSSFKEMVLKTRPMMNRNERYFAINTLHKDTVEVRLFAGTIEVANFWKDLEFCRALFDYCKIASIKDVAHGRAREFKKFVKQHPKDYRDLEAFFSRRNGVGSDDQEAELS